MVLAAIFAVLTPTAVNCVDKFELIVVVAEAMLIVEGPTAANCAMLLTLLELAAMLMELMAT